MTYRITYGPPLTIKDRPHREADTAPGRQEMPERDQGACEQLTVLDAVHIADAVEMVEVSIEQIEAPAVG